VVGTEFRGRVHEGSFGVLGPKFKRVFLVGVRRAGTSSEWAGNYEGREFDSRTRLVVGRAAWVGPSSEGGFMREFLGSWAEVQAGFLGRSQRGRERVRSGPATMRAASSTRGPDWLWVGRRGRRGRRGWGRVPRAGSWGEFRGSWTEVQAGFLGRSPQGRERVRSVSQL